MTEPSDEECEVIAMLLGPYHRYLRTVRVYGKRVIRDGVNLTYIDPVTLEVVYHVGQPDDHVMDLVLNTKGEI